MVEQSEVTFGDLNTSWEQSDNLSNLIVVPLDETEYKLIHENYRSIMKTRGISKKYCRI